MIIREILEETINGRSVEKVYSDQNVLIKLIPFSLDDDNLLFDSTISFVDLGNQFEETNIPIQDFDETDVDENYE